MSLSATIEAAINASILDVDQFQEVTFGMSLLKGASSGDYDPVLGQVTNTNTVIPGKIILPGASLMELDGESISVTTLQGIILRSWITGVQVEVDDEITVNSGVYAGRWIVESITGDSVVHFELALKSI